MGIEPLIYGGVFVGVLLLVNAIYLAVFGKSINANRKVNRRLEMLEKGDTREKVLSQLRKELDQHGRSRNVPLYSMLADKAEKAAIAFSPKQLIFVMIGMAVFSFIALGLMTGAGLPVRALLAVTFGVGGVYFWVNMKAKKRMSMIEEQLPDAVELMVRSLRVGYPFSQALTLVANEVKDPLGSELGVIADQSAYGADLGESIKEMAERLDLQDVRFLAVAVTIQQTSGGNLAEILDGLAKVIRARFRLFRKVKAITAEAQWSGNFLSAFPMMALVFIQVAKPDYYDPVKDHPMFVPGAITVAIMLALNLIVMRKLVNIKV